MFRPAQHIGDLTAHFARVKRVAPQLSQRRARQAQGLGLAQAGCHFRLAAGHQHHGLGFFLQAKGNRIIRGGIAGMQSSDHIKALGHEVRMRGLCHRHVQEMHALKAQVCGQLLRGFHQWCAGFNAVDAALALRLEVQVIQDEAQIGLASPVVSQGDGVIVLAQLFQNGFNELIQVIHLLELAARVLVELAVTREDMQRLEQLNALTGFQVQLCSNILRSRLRLAFASLVVFRHFLNQCLSSGPWPVTGQRAATSRSSQPTIPMSSSTFILRS